MSVSPSKVVDLAKRFQKERPISDPNHIYSVGERLHALLSGIPQKVTHFEQSKDQYSALQIIETLNQIKNLLVPFEHHERVKVLTEIHTKDKKRWKEYKWEEMEFENQKWHENNNPYQYNKIGILPEQVLKISVAALKGDIFSQVIHLVDIYGLSREQIAVIDRHAQYTE